VTVPVWALLAFAVWTLILLLATVGVYRWTRILTGTIPIKDFRADQVEGEGWYKRAMRAHANCIENLPVFGAVVLALHIGDVRGLVVNYLCIGVVVARMMQSLVHVCFAQTNTVVAVRFALFQIQVISFLALSVTIVRQVGMAS
jgi:uncharacterized MAPEG superfamily protein